MFPPKICNFRFFYKILYTPCPRWLPTSILFTPHFRCVPLKRMNMDTIQSRWAPLLCILSVYNCFAEWRDLHLLSYFSTLHFLKALEILNMSPPPLRADDFDDLTAYLTINTVPLHLPLYSTKPTYLQFHLLYFTQTVSTADPTILYKSTNNLLFTLCRFMRLFDWAIFCNYFTRSIGKKNDFCASIMKIFGKCFKRYTSVKNRYID